MTMQNHHLRKLIAIGSPGLGAGQPTFTSNDSVMCEGLKEMLALKNGFFAFESALHVFPFGSTTDSMSLDEWNSETAWKNCYGALTQGLYFFAQDIFGGQFCIRGADICIFDPETGLLEQIATDLEDWARLVLEDYHYLTGYELSHEWQLVHGPLPNRQRLMPKIPFVLGGAFNIENLVAIDSLKSMRVRSALALQLKDLPDGETIVFEYKD